MFKLHKILRLIRVLSGVTLAFGAVGSQAQLVNQTMWQSRAVTASFTTNSQSFNDNLGALGTWPGGMTAWSKRKKINILNGSNPETETNFPVLVILNSSKINYGDFQGAGQDLRFTDSSGTSLNFEIEKWNTSGDSFVWVNIPSIAANSNAGYFWMYWGNAVAADGQNASGVWNSNYKGVYHLGSNFNDSTSYANNLTNVSTTINSSGLAGSARTIASTQYLQTPNNLYWGTGSPNTLSTCFKVTGSGAIFGTSNGAYPAGPGSWTPEVYVDTGGNLRGGFWTGSVQQVISPSPVNDNRWHCAALVLNGTNFKLYLDGSLLGSLTPGAPGPTEQYTYLGLAYTGSWPNGSGGWMSLSGSIDETRLSNVARSANWIATEYLTLNDLYLSQSITQTQSSGLVTATVALARTSGQTVTVPYTVSGTAVNPTDYVLADGTLTLTPGMSSSAITFSYLRNPSLVVNKTVILTLGTPTNATLISPSVQTITLNAPGNTAPTAGTLNLTFNGGVSPATGSVLSVASDAEGDVLTVQSVSAASSGTSSFSGYAISYTPNAGFTGTDSFTYQIADENGATSVGTVNVTVSAPYCPSGYWTGSVGDHDWNNASNWCSSVKPSSSIAATFDPLLCSGSNCDVTIAVDPNVKGITIKAGYPGVISQSGATAITIGSSGWTQAGGTFTGASGAMTFNGPVNLTGGTFNATSGTMTVSNSWTGAGATFNRGSSTMSLAPTSSGYIYTFGSETYNNVTVNTSYNASVSGTMNIAGTLNVSSIGCCLALNGGTLNALGNVNFSNNGFVSGSTIVKIGGSTNQTITGTSNAYINSLTIASTGGTVTFSGTLWVAGDYTFTSGTLNAGTSTLKLSSSANSAYTFGTETYNNVLWTMNHNGTDTASGTMNVAGTFTADQSGCCRVINGGTVNLLGDANFSNNGMFGGTIIIRVGGSGNQTITGTSTAVFPSLVIASTGGTVLLSGTIRVARTYTFTSGNLNAGTSTLLLLSNDGVAGTYTVGTETYNNVTVEPNNFTSTLTGTMNIAGTLTADIAACCTGINGGTLNALGNVVFTNSGLVSGTTTVKIGGSTNQTFSATTGAYVGNVTIASTGGTVTLSSPATIFSVNGATNVTSGTVTLAGGTTTYSTGTLTLNANTFTKNGGTLKVGGSTVATGSLYGGTVAP